MRANDFEFISCQISIYLFMIQVKSVIYMQNRFVCSFTLENTRLPLDLIVCEKKITNRSLIRKWISMVYCSTTSMECTVFGVFFSSHFRCTFIMKLREKKIWLNASWHRPILSALLNYYYYFCCFFFEIIIVSIF